MAALSCLGALFSIIVGNGMVMVQRKPTAHCPWVQPRLSHMGKAWMAWKKPSTPRFD